MKIIAVSDSHGEISFFDLAQKDALMLHCGDHCLKEKEFTDRPFIYVNGNCDRRNEDKYRLIEYQGKRILLIHGHTLNVKIQLNSLIYFAIEHNVQYCFFGHTHRQTAFMRDGIYFINPGVYRYYHEYAIVEENEINLFSRNGKQTIKL